MDLTSVAVSNGLHRKRISPSENQALWGLAPQGQRREKDDLQIVQRQIRPQLSNASGDAAELSFGVWLFRLAA